MFSETAVAKVDARPYFERVLCHALKEGLVDEARLASIRREGAKGIVQLAGFFGTANLRPELEAARTRLVTLVGLALEAEAGGQLDAAARLLRDKSLLALSKAGAERLRGLLKLPTDSFLEPPNALNEDEKVFLSRWTFDEPMTFARYLLERKAREKNHNLHELSYWLAGKFGVSRDEVQGWHVSCDSVVNSVLLVLFAEKNPKGFFSGERFTKLHEAARKKRKHDFALLDEWREEAPPALQALLDRAREHFLSDVLALIRGHEAIDLYRRQERFSGLFFFDASDVDEVTHHDKAMEEEWRRITGGHGDHTDVQCTALLMVATGLDPTPVLRKKDAIAIWQHFRDAGFDDKAVEAFIETVVPFEYQADVLRLWQEDLGPEAGVKLDDDIQAHALTYLHEACRPGWKKKP